jgi:hypothetical protein
MLGFNMNEQFLDQDDPMNIHSWGNMVFFCLDKYISYTRLMVNAIKDKKFIIKCSFFN